MTDALDRQIEGKATRDLRALALKMRDAEPAVPLAPEQATTNGHASKLEPTLTCPNCKQLRLRLNKKGICSVCERDGNVTPAGKLRILAARQDGAAGKLGKAHAKAAAPAEPAPAGRTCGCGPVGRHRKACPTKAPAPEAAPAARRPRRAKPLRTARKASRSRKPAPSLAKVGRDAVGVSAELKAMQDILDRWAALSPASRSWVKARLEA